jgi:hypothetical protein
MYFMAFRSDQRTTRVDLAGRPRRVNQVAVTIDSEEPKCGIAGSGVAGLPMTDGTNSHTKEIGRRLSVETGINASVTELLWLDDLETRSFTTAPCEPVILPIM